MYKIIFDHFPKRTSPSGAHTQSWFFAVIRDAETKRKLREIVEEEEKINYEKRMSKEWLEDLKKINTSWEKEYFSTAPYIIVSFKLTYSLSPENKK